MGFCAIAFGELRKNARRVFDPSCLYLIELLARRSECLQQGDGKKGNRACKRLETINDSEVFLFFFIP